MWPARRVSGDGESLSLAFPYDKDVPIFEYPENRDAYIRMAVANARAMEASNDYAAEMEKRLAAIPNKEEVAGHLLTIQKLRAELEVARVNSQRSSNKEKTIALRDVEAIQEKCKRVFEGRDAFVRKACHRARRSLAGEYDGVLDAIRARLRKKKEETAVEVALQVVEVVKSALLCSQGDPPDLWQPPGDGVSLRVNPGRGGGGSIPGAGNKTWSNSKEDS
ncbi:hypothetical protein Bca52824_023674 [Brassica carinata]|uniref:Uncharacterized protein n=1 Tax=Brassica carinata TaxID=52824 RepID=A0A8X8AVX8_BRACI|nr:hypothetical protein Bca52824_023674 [Brassica carinata]